ncbi:MAG: helix-turn-helix transcriptional regulator [Clostridia bacterium]|nr:helix-turn-helix transcriptional regulator [Clostridia bacterium]
MLGVSLVQHMIGSALPSAHSHTGAHQMIFVRLGDPILYIDGVRYTANAPCVVFISRLEQHSLHLGSGQYERYTVNFDPDTLASGEELRLLSVFTNRPERFCHILPLDETVAQRLSQLLSFAEEECARREDAFPRAVDDLVRAALLYLLRSYPAFFPDDSESNAAVIVAVRRTIEHRLRDELSLAELGQQFHLNPYYLAHRFKAVTGYSVKNYQLRCRVAAARMLLESTELRMTEICERVGFSDVSSFSRYFRREVGVTPTQYRNTRRESAARE